MLPYCSHPLHHDIEQKISRAVEGRKNLLTTEKNGIITHSSLPFLLEEVITLENEQIYVFPFL